MATGGVWDPFVLLPKILGCWVFFARAFLLGRLVVFFVEKILKIFLQKWPLEFPPVAILTADAEEGSDVE